MEIKKFVEGETLTIELIGDLDVLASTKLDVELNNATEGMKILVLDLAKLNYIASAGLRILLKYQKQANRKDCIMKIKNVKGEVREIFDTTGFSDFLNIVDDSVKRLSVDFEGGISNVS